MMELEVERLIHEAKRVLSGLADGGISLVDGANRFRAIALEIDQQRPEAARMILDQTITLESAGVGPSGGVLRPGQSMGSNGRVRSKADGYDAFLEAALDSLLIALGGDGEQPPAP